jgi:hypothetical protein
MKLTNRRALREGLRRVDQLFVHFINKSTSSRLPLPFSAEKVCILSFD